MGEGRVENHHGHTSFNAHPYLAIDSDGNCNGVCACTSHVHHVYITRTSHVHHVYNTHTSPVQHLYIIPTSPIYHLYSTHTSLIHPHTSPVHHSQIIYNSLPQFPASQQCFKLFRRCLGKGISDIMARSNIRPVCKFFNCSVGVQVRPRNTISYIIACSNFPAGLQFFQLFRPCLGKGISNTIARSNIWPVCKFFNCSVGV